MKKTKMRKKMLLSSIAMLMVATVSLGSATYAWFTSNPNSTATALKLKATAANGLQVLSASQKLDETLKPSSTIKYSEDWSHNATLNWDKNTHAASANSFSLDAVSFDLNATRNVLETQAYNFEAGDDNSSAAKGTATASIKTTGFFTEKVYAKLTGSATEDNVQLTGVKVDWKDSTISIDNTIRVVVTYHDNSEDTDKMLGVFAKNAGSIDFIPAGTTTATTYNTVTKGSAEAVAFATGSTGKWAEDEYIDAGLVDTTGNDYFQVTVYLDGEDAACFTNNVSAEDIVNSIVLNFDLAA